MNDNGPKKSKVPWFRIAEGFLFLWALTLLIIGLRYFYYRPILPWPDKVNSEEIAKATSTARPTITATEKVTVEATMTDTPIPTWSPSALPRQNSPSPVPEQTATSSPTPSITFTPSPSPRAYWNPNPTPITATITPENTSVTAIPTRLATVEVPDDAITIMLLGSDNRPGTAGWLTDVIIVVLIDTQGPSVSMLSIPRDLYVWVPEWKMSKINTVDAHGSAVGYAGGGPGLLKQTLLYNLGIPVQYYARVNLEGFKDIIDTLGGIEVPVTCEMTDWRLKAVDLEPEDEENWELYTLDQQIHPMDGEMALWYSRARKHSSDFDRNRRQQQVLRAILDKALAIDIIPQIPQLWNDFSDTVATDLGLGEILQLAVLASKIDTSNIKGRFISGDAVLSWYTPDQHLYTLLPQAEPMQEVIEDFVAPPPTNRARQDSPIVKIINGTDRKDIDSLAAANLLWDGLVPITGEEAQQGYGETIVTFFGQNFKGANPWRVAWLFGIDQSEIIVQPNPDSAVDYQVVLGYDYDPCVHRAAGARAVPTSTPTPEETLTNP